MRVVASSSQHRPLSIGSGWCTTASWVLNAGLATAASALQHQSWYGSALPCHSLRMQAAAAVAAGVAGVAGAAPRIDAAAGLRCAAGVGAAHAASVDAAGFTDVGAAAGIGAAGTACV